MPTNAASRAFPPSASSDSTKRSLPPSVISCPIICNAGLLDIARCATDEACDTAWVVSLEAPAATFEASAAARDATAVAIPWACFLNVSHDILYVRHGAAATRDSVHGQRQRCLADEKGGTAHKSIQSLAGTAGVAGSDNASAVNQKQIACGSFEGGRIGLVARLLELAGTVQQPLCETASLVLLFRISHK